MNMNKNQEEAAVDTKKVLDAIVLIKNKEKNAEGEKSEGGEANLEKIVQKLAQRHKQSK